MLCIILQKVTIFHMLDKLCELELFYLCMAYLTTLSTAQIMWDRMIGQLVKNELGRM